MTSRTKKVLEPMILGVNKGAKLSPKNILNQFAEIYKIMSISVLKKLIVRKVYKTQNYS